MADGFRHDDGRARVAIDVRELHVVSDDEARGAFTALLGRGDVWASELMQYRTTSEWQDD